MPADLSVSGWVFLRQVTLKSFPGHPYTIIILRRLSCLGSTTLWVFLSIPPCVRAFDYELGPLTRDMDLVKWRKFRSYSYEFNSTDILRRLVTILYDDMWVPADLSVLGWVSMKQVTLTKLTWSHLHHYHLKMSVCQQFFESLLLLQFFFNLDQTWPKVRTHKGAKNVGNRILNFCLCGK